PLLWERTLAEDASSRWPFPAPPPDVVVVNLGTNDFWKGDPGPSFETAYTAFLVKIRARYPAAPIIAALGPLLDGEKLTATRTDACVSERQTSRHDQLALALERRVVRTGLRGAEGVLELRRARARSGRRGRLHRHAELGARRERDFGARERQAGPVREAVHDG